MEYQRQESDPAAGGTASYRSAWKTLLRRSDFWKSLRPARTPYVNFWVQETYTRYKNVSGMDPETEAAWTNNYVQHPARLAFTDQGKTKADKKKTAAAKRFFDLAYVPIETGFWVRPFAVDGMQTKSLSLRQMQQFISMQIYATKKWAATPGRRYPDRRIGFNWSQGTNTNPAHPTERTLGSHRALAMRLAFALKGAYSKGGTALWACDPFGGVTTKFCAVPFSKNYPATAPRNWYTFGSW